jgi:hypothetical protein
LTLINVNSFVKNGLGGEPIWYVVVVSDRNGRRLAEWRAGSDSAAKTGGGSIKRGRHKVARWEHPSHHLIEGIEATPPRD